MTRTFSCYVCKNSFSANNSKEDAKKEAIKNGFDDPKDRCSLCDYCFHKAMGHIIEEGIYPEYGYYSGDDWIKVK